MSATAPTAPFRDQRRGNSALLIVDMIGPMAFGPSAEMHQSLAHAAERIAMLRDACERVRVPVIFANDNFGEWHSEASRLVERALAPDSNGRAYAERLRPREADYFIIKPQYSAFYATNLPVLLPKLGVSRLIVTGTAADMCVLFTAADARMRDYALWVPEDCVAAQAADRKGWAVELMRANMAAEVRPTDDYTLDAWLGAAQEEEE